MVSEDSKYSRIEFERRFLVSADAGWQRCVESFSKTLEDKYIRGTRLRLRILTDSDSDRQMIKLNKKYPSDSPYYQQIGRVLLTRAELKVFDALDGDRLRKVRYYQTHHSQVFSIDVFEGELNGLVLCETEAESLKALLAVVPPDYVSVEVTEDPFFTGGNLCRVRRAELMSKLAAL